MTVHTHAQPTADLTWWNAVVSWETPDPLDQDLDALDLIIENLDGYHASVSNHPVDGTWEARISLQAPTLDVAVTAALDVVGGATGEKPVGVEVVREDLFVARLPHIQPLV